MNIIERKNFGAKLEPVNLVLHGAGQDLDSFMRYAAVFPRDNQPAVYMTYIGITGDTARIMEWGEDLQRECEAIAEQGLYLQIGLNMTGGNDQGIGMEDVVARGEKDDNLALFCDFLQRLALPSFVRIGYEFEGNWNGYRPKTYCEAFVHVTKMMRQRQLNVATVWCSAGASAGTRSLAELMTYYPGDEWVDWWGIDTFDATEMTSRATRRFCETAGERGKPVMIGEATPRGIGVLDGQVSWDEWFAPFFSLIHKQPEIKLFSYINWDWTHWSDALGFAWHDWGDCRIEQNSVVASNYLAEMCSPLYEHLAV